MEILDWCSHQATQLCDSFQPCNAQDSCDPHLVPVSPGLHFPGDPAVLVLALCSEPILEGQVADSRAVTAGERQPVLLVTASGCG